jgi:hypothetical protein
MEYGSMSGDLKLTKEFKKAIMSGKVDLVNSSHTLTFCISVPRIYKDKSIDVEIFAKLLDKDGNEIVAFAPVEANLSEGSLLTILDVQNVFNIKYV